MKKKQQQLQANQDLLIDRWTDVLAAEEYGLKRPAKSYPKRRLLPQFDVEAPEPIPPSRNAERPPRGRDKTATQAEQQPAPSPRKNRDKTARDHTYDLRQDLDSRAGHTRSIYGSRGRFPTQDDGYLFGRDKPSHTRADNPRRTSSCLRHPSSRSASSAGL